MSQYVKFVKFGTDPKLLVLSASLVASFGYWYIFARPHRKSRRELERQLSQAQKTVRDLEDVLLSLADSDGNQHDSGKEVRIWMDGAFDMMHYGHMNAFRQGRALGTKLIVGVNSDETITICKGKPVNSDAERIATVRGCKWVDEVVTNVPYIMNEEYLNYVIEKYKIDYVVHGDDPCIVNGKDVYESAQKLGKYLTIPRTEGISTTDIVGRMLLMTRDHHAGDGSTDRRTAIANGESAIVEMSANEVFSRSVIDKTVAGGAVEKAFTRKSNFLTTSRTIRLFGAGVKAPKKGDRVVYLAGAWDMFHAGHVDILEQAKSLGDYVIVGVHSDSIVNQLRGLNLPILNLHERVLSVLGCQWVDDVLIDAPYVITKEMITSLNISMVLRGTVNSSGDSSDSTALSPPNSPKPGNASVDPYGLPRSMGILRTLESSMSLSVEDILERIQSQREKFVAKFSVKRVQEEEYYQQKYGNVL